LPTMYRMHSWLHPSRTPGWKTMPKSDVGKWFWHIHHEKLAERATEPIEERRRYIQAQKPKAERKLRLARLGIVKDQRALNAAAKAYTDKVSAAKRVQTHAETFGKQAYAAIVDPAEEKAKTVWGPAWDAFEKERNRFCKAEKTLGAGHADRTAYNQTWKAYNEANQKTRPGKDEAQQFAMMAYEGIVKPARKVRYAMEDEATTAWDKTVMLLHRKECRGCPWKGSLFYRRGR
jgi:hypothetical protein